jgi:hypothetical protein
MKHLFFCLMMMAMVQVLAQNQAPVAVNDTVYCKVGETVTVNVLANDYDPDGDSIRFFNKNFGDSAISYTIDYEERYWFKGIIKRPYGIVDKDNGVILDTIVMGNLVLIVENNSFDSLYINNISARFAATGNHFHTWPGNWGHEVYTGCKSTFNYPANTRKSTIFTNTFWIGGIDEAGQLHCSAERFRQYGYDFNTGPLSTDGLATADSANGMDWFRIWKLNRTDVDYHVIHCHEAGYQPIEPIATWPAKGKPDLNQYQYIAPFMDVNNDGAYKPLDGDYPLIRGDQCLFFVFNDKQIKNRESKPSLPLGVEVHGMAYGFNSPDSALANTVFLNYKIFNRSSTDYTNTYVGVWTDFDIGFGQDDYLQCDVSRGYYMGLNGDSIDGQGEIEAYGLYPPIQATQILGGPYMDEDKLDNPTGGCDFGLNGANFGDGIVDNERLGLTGFVYHPNDWTPHGDPVSGHDYYNYMQGLWSDDSVMYYGGNAYPGFSVGPRCRFMFPGDSDPCNWGTNGIAPNGGFNTNGLYWTEQTAGNSPSDRRGLGSIGPFTFKAGSCHKLDVAFVVGRSFNNQVSAIDVLNQRVDTLRALFAKDSENFGRYVATGEAEMAQQTFYFTLIPNPANDIVNIRLGANGSAMLELFDMFGTTFIKQQLTNQQTTLHLNMLKPGLYLVKVSNGKTIATRKLIVN